MDKAILKLIYNHRKFLTRQQIRTLRGQVLAGDHEGALRGLKRLLGKEDQ